MTEADRVPLVIESAQALATNTAHMFFRDQLGGRDQFPCGFAWVRTSVKGNTRLGRALLKAGFSKAYGGGLQWWNPSDLPVQNVDTKYIGAQAAARYLTQELGAEFYADQRWD